MENSINLMFDFLSNTSYISGSHVMVVGGELFDKSNLDLNKKILSVFEKLFQYQLRGLIDLLYVNTNLIYEDISLLSEVLNRACHMNLNKRLKFTTSWDKSGRFLNDKSIQVWNKNMELLTLQFHQINKVINTILTRQLCESMIAS